MFYFLASVEPGSCDVSSHPSKRHPLHLPLPPERSHDYFTPKFDLCPWERLGRQCIQQHLPRAVVCPPGQAPAFRSHGLCKQCNTPTSFYGRLTPRNLVVSHMCQSFDVSSATSPHTQQNISTEAPSPFEMATDPRSRERWSWPNMFLLPKLLKAPANELFPGVQLGPPTYGQLTLTNKGEALDSTAVPCSTKVTTPQRRPALLSAVSNQSSRCLQSRLHTIPSVKTSPKTPAKKFGRGAQAPLV